MATINVDLNQIASIMETGVRRASSFMSLGLRVAADDAVTSVKLDSNFQTLFMPDPLSAEASKDVRKNFSTWVIGGGLRELDQNCAVFLDRLYPILIGMAASGKVPDGFHARVRSFELDTSIRSKLERIGTEFKILVTDTRHFGSLSRARNALTHNLGFVADRHFSTDDALIVTWRGLDMVAGSRTVSGPFEAFKVEAGESISVGMAERSRTFKKGQQIEFTSHDLNEMCLMFQLLAGELVRAAVKFAESAGVPINDKSKTPAIESGKIKSAGPQDS